MTSGEATLEGLRDEIKGIMQRRNEIRKQCKAIVDEKRKYIKDTYESEMMYLGYKRSVLSIELRALECCLEAVTQLLPTQSTRVDLLYMDPVIPSVESEDDTDDEWVHLK